MAIQTLASQYPIARWLAEQTKQLFHQTLNYNLEGKQTSEVQDHFLEFFLLAKVSLVSNRFARSVSTVLTL